MALPAVDPGFDLEEMVHTMICAGPVVTWHVFWESAFAPGTRFPDLNRHLFGSMILSVIYRSKVSCNDLLSIVNRMKGFVDSKLVKEKMGDRIDGLRKILETILGRANPCIHNSSDGHRDNYKPDFETRNTALLETLKDDLRDFSCAIQGGLFERWKKANGLLAGELRGGHAEVRALLMAARDEVTTNPEYVSFWADDIRNDLVSASHMQSPEKFGVRLMGKFKKQLRIHDRKDPRWAILLKAVYQAYRANYGTVFAEYAEIIIRQIERHTGLLIGPLVQNDPVLNILSLEDPLIWPEMAYDSESSDDDDKIKSETWKILDHFYKRWDECNYESKHDETAAKCLLKGLEHHERYAREAQVFVKVRRGSWESTAPLPRDFEWDLLTMSPEEWIEKRID